MAELWATDDLSCCASDIYSTMQHVKEFYGSKCKRLVVNLKIKMSPEREIKNVAVAPANARS